MQKGQIILGFFVPAHQNATKAIQPTMTPLDHPPARFLASLAHHHLGFYPPRANVRRKAKLLKDAEDLIVVVDFIQATALRVLCRWFRPFDQDALESELHQLHIMAVRPRYHYADRDALSLR